MGSAILASCLVFFLVGDLELNPPQNAPALTRPAKPPAASGVALPTPLTPPAKIPSSSPADPTPLGRRAPAEPFSLAPAAGRSVSRGPSPGPAAEVSSPAPSPKLPDFVVTRQTLFSIPIHVDSFKDSARQPVEVQLFVSHDQGARWNYYTKAPPTQRQIPFKTARDAEYWFALRTRSRDGKLRPEQIPGPGLRVVVDTKPPLLQLAANTGPNGQITAEWTLADPHLKQDSLRLHYRSSDKGPWQTIALTAQNAQVLFSGSAETGEVTWWPPPGAEKIQLRAEAADAAGNRAVGHAQVKCKRKGNPRARLAQNHPSQHHSPAGAVAQNIHPPVGNRYPTGQPGPIDSGFGFLPPGERVRMINSRLFELDYDVETVGPSGIGRVELWGTRDGGRSWRSYGVDHDNHSPISVAVDEEGLYGFRMVLTNGVGIGAGPPQSGDLPAIWIGVDLSKPSARLLAAEVGPGTGENKLVITWEAEDRMPAARPITLNFSDQPGGPWTPIAAGLENTGRYVWTLDSRLPPQVYLRLEVRDEAGNLTVVDRPEPVPLDRSRPKAKILDVRPTLGKRE